MRCTGMTAAALDDLARKLRQKALAALTWPPKTDEQTIQSSVLK
jgi:hypothetical protein